MKNHTRKSRASGSELAKLRRLEQRGWRPGHGYVGEFLRSAKRRQKKADRAKLETDYQEAKA